MKKWWIFGADLLWIFGADFFTVYGDFSRFIRDINGETKKNLVIDDLFHGLPPRIFPSFDPSPRRLGLQR